MRNRIDVLNDLLRAKGDISSLEKELLKYSWDVEESLVFMSRDDFSRVLNSCIKGEISSAELVDWANIVECREDISLDELVQEFIFELASPEINGDGEITETRLKEMIRILRLSKE